MNTNVASASTSAKRGILFTGMLRFVLGVVLACCSIATVDAQRTNISGLTAADLSNSVAVISSRLTSAEAVQRKIEGDVAQVLQALQKIDQEVKVIRKEVDKPLISELWFGFVSDRFTTMLNRIFGFESGPSTPLWAAGILSVGFMLMKFLMFFINRAHPDSKLAKVLGKTFGVLVYGCLLVLTVSVIMLAIHGRGSSLDDYRQQVKASDKLTAEMKSVSAKLSSLDTQLESSSAAIKGLAPALNRVVPAQSMIATQVPPATIAAITTIERLSGEHHAVLSRMTNDIKVLQAEIAVIKEAQHGGLWNFLVIVPALAVLGVLCVGAWPYVKKLFS